MNEFDDSRRIDLKGMSDLSEERIREFCANEMPPAEKEVKGGEKKVESDEKEIPLANVKEVPEQQLGEESWSVTKTVGSIAVLISALAAYILLMNSQVEEGADSATDNRVKQLRDAEKDLLHSRQKVQASE